MENKKLPDTSEVTINKQICEIRNNFQDSGDSDQECLTWDQKSDEEGSKDSIDVRKKKLGGKRQQGNSGSGTWSAGQFFNAYFYQEINFTLPTNEWN